MIGVIIRGVAGGRFPMDKITWRSYLNLLSPLEHDATIYSEDNLMTDFHSESGQTLREKAQNMAKNLTYENSDSFTPDEINNILYELRVHQIELELQNNELREMLEQLETSRALYSDLYDFSPVGYLTINEGGAIIEANLTAATFLGVDRKSLLKQEIPRYIHPEDQIDFNRLYERIMETGVRQDCETRMMRADGSSFWAHLDVNTVWKGEYRFIISDISKHKQAEKKLLETNEMFSQFLSHSPVYAYIKEVTPTGSRVLRASDNFAQMIGMSGSEMSGKQMEELFPPEFAEKINKDDQMVVSSCQTMKVDEYFNGRNYTTIKFPISMGDRILLAGYTIDTTDRCVEETERLNLERQLLYIHKMESLGRMSAGIAHDFNNLLQVVLGNLELASMKLPKDSDVCRNIDQASRATEHAAKLSGLMLAYSGRAQLSTMELNLNELVEEYSKLLAASIPNSIVFEIKLAEVLPLIKADAGQLEQVLMSLIANSSEAIGDAEGSITISTGVSEFDQTDLNGSRLKEKLPAGRYVWIEVRDSGCGMDDDTLYKLFDPFFTTKFTGRGLSMSATHGIISVHGGGIFVESRPGGGTKIRILFPIAISTPVEVESVSNENPQAQPAAINNPRVVLIVDDDEAPCKVMAAMLAELGYVVLTASDGEEAQKIFREQSDRIRVVLLNKSMPRMNGIILIRELKSINPDVKILLASGHSEDEIAERFEGVGMDAFMQKPFSMSRLEKELLSLMMEK